MDIITTALAKKLGGISVSKQDVTEAVEGYLAKHPEAMATTDDTLSIEGIAADAKAVGDAIDEVKEWISEDIKEALLACFANVAWEGKNGRLLYNNLQTALEKGQKVQYSFSFEDIDFRIGGLEPGGSTDGRATVSWNDLTNRACMKSIIPFRAGTITAKSGYKVCVYQIPDDDVAFAYKVTNGVIAKKGSGYDLGVNTSSVPYTFPAWEQSVAISSTDGCKYVCIGFKKDSNADWTSGEIQNIYGTVFTASYAELGLADILNFTNRYSLNPHSVGTLDGVTRYKIDSSSELTARARSNFIPLTKGTLASVDPSKYSLCMYSIDVNGLYVEDQLNPILSNGFPAWGDSFTIHDGCSGVLLSLKKNDGTDFTASELANAYGTIFDYIEEE